MALNQWWQCQQWGDDEDSGDGDGDGNGGVVVVEGGGGWMCHCPQRRSGGGGVVRQPCLPTRVYRPMTRTRTMMTPTQ